MQQHGRAGHDRPAGPGAQGIDRQAGQPEVGQRRRELHRDPDGRIGRIDCGLERRLDRREHAPHVAPSRVRTSPVRTGSGRTASRGHWSRSGGPSRTNWSRSPRNPGVGRSSSRRTIPIAKAATSAAMRRPDHAAGRRRRVQRVRRVQMPNTARPSHRPRRMPPWIARTSGRRRPSPSCRRTAARSGSCTG